MNQVYIPFLVLFSSCATCFRVALCKDSVASLPVECWDLDPLLATETIAIYQQDWDFNDLVGWGAPRMSKIYERMKLGVRDTKRHPPGVFLLEGLGRPFLFDFQHQAKDLPSSAGHLPVLRGPGGNEALAVTENISHFVQSKMPPKKTAPVCQTDSSTLYSHYKIYKCLVDDVLNELRPIHTWNSRMILDNFPSVPGLFFGLVNVVAKKVRHTIKKVSYNTFKLNALSIQRIQKSIIMNKHLWMQRTDI